MSVCPTCKGSGIAPETIKLECVGCQRPVTLSYTTSTELREKCENVRCVECRKAKR